MPMHIRGDAKCQGPKAAVWTLPSAPRGTIRCSQNSAGHVRQLGGRCLSANQRRCRRCADGRGRGCAGDRRRGARGANGRRWRGGLNRCAGRQKRDCDGHSHEERCSLLPHAGLLSCPLTHCSGRGGRGLCRGHDAAQEGAAREVVSPLSNKHAIPAPRTWGITREPPSPAAWGWGLTTQKGEGIWLRQRASDQPLVGVTRVLARYPGRVGWSPAPGARCRLQCAWQASTPTGSLPLPSAATRAATWGRTAPRAGPRSAPCRRRPGT